MHSSVEFLHTATTLSAAKCMEYRCYVSTVHNFMSNINCCSSLGPRIETNTCRCCAHVVASLRTGYLLNPSCDFTMV